MQIVIEIPSAMYNDIKSGKDGYSNYVHTAVRIGTPLLKGHGRLIDANELKTAFPCGESVRTECVRATIDYAPTIIEADKESEGEERGDIIG